MVDLNGVSGEQFSDPWWRLNNLYTIRDKDGHTVQFRMWPEQRELYEDMWFRNLVLKSRQRGCTTFIQLFILDRCLFHGNTAAGVIAHTREDAEAFFDNKIKFAYDHLPGEIREGLYAPTKNKRELRFSNGSYIRVGTSHRSGTLQYLHVSELGKLSALRPDRASEVKSGAFPTVDRNGFIFVESTAEGRQGVFFDLAQEALALQRAGVELTPLDFRAFFFPWFRAAEYRLSGQVHVPDQLREYFENLEEELGITLDQEQRNWYVKMAATQGDKMRQEYPSTPEEAFEKLLKGAIFGEQLQTVRADGRVCKLPFQRTLPVNVYWDLGHNDINAMWFQQRDGPWDHFIDYYEHRLVKIDHYIDRLNELQQERGYQYGTMYLPHDGKQNHIEAIAGSVADILRRHGFRVRVVDRPFQKVASIDAARLRFDACRFDVDRCDAGLKHLANYQWTWDEQGETFRKTPKHNAASNGADAFQTFGWARKTRGDGGSGQAQRDIMARDRLLEAPGRVIAGINGAGYSRVDRARARDRGDDDRYGHIL